MIRALIANGGYKLYRKGVETTLLYDAVDTNFSKVLLSALDFQICDDNQKSMGSVGEYIEEFLLRLAVTEAKLELTNREAATLGRAAPQYIYDVDFVDVASQNTVTAMKEARVNQPWTHMVLDLESLVLFGKHFGQLIRPSQPNTLCESWKTVPSSKNYLAVTGQVLHNILSSQQQPDGSTRLGKRIHWQKSPLLFDKCSCIGKACPKDPVQVLLTVLHERGQKGLFEAVEAYRCGGFIFGKKRTVSVSLA
jgi:hypothetical protein